MIEYAYVIKQVGLEDPICVCGSMELAEEEVEKQYVYIAQDLMEIYGWNMQRAYKEARAINNVYWMEYKIQY